MEITKISLEQAVKINRLAPRIKKFLDENSAYLLRLAQNGTSIPEHKLVERKGNRKWISDEAKVVEGLKKLGIEDPFRKTLVGIGSVEDKLGKSKKIKEAISELTESHPSVYTLVPIEDERPPVSISESRFDLLSQL